MEPDLIILCAHGASGMRDMVVGSIAQQVIGRGKTPVLLLQPGDPNLPNPVRLESFLITLDGDSDHEQALKLAGELALHLNSSLNLLTVIPTMGTLSGEHAAAGRLLPGTASAMLDMTEECSIDYLEEAAQTWRDKGLKVFTGIRRGDPVHQIMAASKNMDLIVLGTHGKSGINAFWAGSVAPKVVPLAKVPLLLVPAEKSKQNH
jgi:nucleotide-binding universal stress UspA family protein